LQKTKKPNIAPFSIHYKKVRNRQKKKSQLSKGIKSINKKRKNQQSTNRQKAALTNTLKTFRILFFRFFPISQRFCELMNSHFCCIQKKSSQKNKLYTKIKREIVLMFLRNGGGSVTKKKLAAKQTTRLFQFRIELLIFVLIGESEKVTKTKRKEQIEALK
jgi:hypothetical protein